jgi:hypothetical protein
MVGKESQYNNSMKIINISHMDIYRSVCDMIYDFVLTDGELLNAWTFLIEDLKTPESFLHALTTGYKAYTFLAIQSIDLESLEAEFAETKEDVLFVVYKGKKPWVTVLLSQLCW